MARLGDIGKIVTGNTPKTSESQNYTSNDICFVKPSDIADGIVTCLNDSEFYISEYARAKARILPPKSVLVTCIGIIGKVAINDVECAFNQQINAIIPDNSKCLTEYLAYAIQNKQPEMQDVANAPVVPILNKTQFSDIEINLPSLTEQEEIVGKLNAVSRLIALRKAQLAKLDQLVKSRFVELFGTTGKQVSLTDYVWFQEGPGVRSVDFTDDGTILLTGSNINDNIISFGHKSDRHISNELASGKYAHFMCDKDDILVVSSAIDPDKFDKKVVVVDVDKKYCLNTGIIRFKPNKQYLTLRYFREFLKTDYFKHQVSSEMRGIAQMHFGPSHLKQMTILLPDSIESQIEFEKFVQQTDKSKLAIQQSLDKLELLKKSLMQEYFG